VTVRENLDELSAEELFEVAERVGLLVIEESTTPDILRARLRRAAL